VARIYVFFLSPIRIRLFAYLFHAILKINDGNDDEEG
jgi:hypothetical protein